MFYYEHIGHMQFASVTLRALEVFAEVTEAVGEYLPWDGVVRSLVERGFSSRQAQGELERLCYGFECADRYVGTRREVALTPLGLMFIDSLIESSRQQERQLAILLRVARRRDHVNAVVQESTFWTRDIHGLTRRFGFRKGPARDFLKRIAITDLLEFVSECADVLRTTTDVTSAPNPEGDETGERCHMTEMTREERVARSGTLPGEATAAGRRAGLLECLQMVEAKGAFWSSVGGKYAWFVFPQRFELPFDDEDWRLYDDLVRALVRPPEWGGGKTLSPKDMVAALGTERAAQVVSLGIVRPIHDASGTVRHYQMTAPGFLMWERRHKGPVLELVLSRSTCDSYDLLRCEASDLPSPKRSYVRNPGLPSWWMNGDKSHVLTELGALLNAFRANSLGDFGERLFQ